MKRLLSAAILAMAASAPAWAQSSSSSTATGTGVGTSTATSQAISGQGGTAAIISSSSVPANQTVKNIPSVFSPGLAAAGIETCLGSVSAGGAFLGTGLTFGTTIPDSGCAARLDARSLWSMGLKKAAVARLCLNSEIYRAMPEVCRVYLPQYAQADEQEPRTIPDIWLVQGTKGKSRLCSNYDVPQQRCRVWAHTVHHPAPRKKSVARGEVNHAAASHAPASAVAKIEKEESQ